MTDELIDYPLLIDKAMRGVVRDVLLQVKAEGLPGEHHFYISFMTDYPGVKISDQLKARYPKEITIVLQHQYWDFKIEQDKFSVTLSFGGMPEKLTIPYDALTAFADPSVKFGLQFQQSDAPLPMGADDLPISNMDDALTLKEFDLDDDGDDDDDDDRPAEIISLDSFRNNK